MIRTNRWLLPTVLAGHAADIVMFDVRPPQQGGRGGRVRVAALRHTEQLEREPEQRLRLRLTVGLRKLDGDWTVTHEHHSFADTTGAA